ncbi:MAG: PEP-CTERM sorting domain-containing protein [Pirellulaceae bacterium]|nr:PEP-CTERM sorting domain-containing protein [Pirellulaceae bacterium]
MRGITVSLLAVLAMSTVAAADVTLHYEVANVQPGGGMRTFTVYAMGTNVNALAEFSVSGVNQVGIIVNPPDPKIITEWINDPLGGTPENDLDSHVLFGQYRFADLNQIPENPPEPGSPPWGPSVTDETVTGGGTSGLGTLVNTADAYVEMGLPNDTYGRFNLFQLVVPKGEAVTLTAVVHAAHENPDDLPYYSLIKSYYFDDEAAIPDVRPEGLGSLEIRCLLDGDADGNGIVSLTDFIALNSNWQQSERTWSDGDFDGDGVVGLTDFIALNANWQQEAAWYAPAAPGEGAAPSAVPEPSTVLMLVLGSLCLAGYRLRK